MAETPTLVSLATIAFWSDSQVLCRMQCHTQSRWFFWEGAVLYARHIIWSRDRVSPQPYPPRFMVAWVLLTFCLVLSRYLFWRMPTCRIQGSPPSWVAFHILFSNLKLVLLLVLIGFMPSVGKGLCFSDRVGTLGSSCLFPRLNPLFISSSLFYGVAYIVLCPLQPVTEFQYDKSDA